MVVFPIGNLWAQSWEDIIDIIAPIQQNNNRRQKSGNLTMLDIVKRSGNF